MSLRGFDLKLSDNSAAAAGSLRLVNIAFVLADDSRRMDPDFDGLQTGKDVLDVLWLDCKKDR